MKLLRDLDISQKRVFVRADLDISLPRGQVTNGERLRTNAEPEQSVRLVNLKPTIDYLTDLGAKQIIIAGHMGRPSVAKAMEGKQDKSESRKIRESEDQRVGKPNYYTEKLSTKQLTPILEKILGQEIGFVSDIYSSSGSREVLLKKEKGSPQGRTILLLENLRFWEGETKNNMEFAKQLANYADIYVNEAFGNCHREHASMAALPSLLPCAAGLNLENEVEILSKVINNPRRPLVAIIGGAKLETKISVIHNLSDHADKVLVGGELPIEITKQQMKMAENVVVSELNQSQKDLSSKDIDLFTAEITKSKTIVWNGPLGLFEEGHIEGSTKIAESIIKSNCYSIVGGGETEQFLAENGLLSQFSFLSTGGGAMLEFLAGKQLPALKALE